MWATLSPPAEAERASGNAQAVRDYLSAHGASFFDEIVEGTGLLRAYAEQGLGELVSLGLVTSDSFSGLRALIEPADARSRGASSMEQAGRWSLIARAKPGANAKQGRAEAVEYVARTLLRRYGVVFWRLLEREPGWLPSWRELLGVFRRLEARGEIRGGRFVAGFAGEQFALPEAIGLLREVRRRDADGKLVSVSGADPLNLVGILTPGARLPAIAANRVLYREGVPIALFAGGEVRSLEGDDDPAWDSRKALLRSPTLVSRRRTLEENPMSSALSEERPIKIDGVFDSAGEG
jgi:ATP-dependent Lhr-like helicase